MRLHIQNKRPSHLALILAAAASFAAVGSAPSLAQCNDLDFFPWEVGYGTQRYEIISFQGSLYMAATGAMFKLVDGAWQTIPAAPAVSRTFIIWNDMLVAGGQLGVWASTDGDNWVDLSQGTTIFANVHALVEYNGDLIVGGGTMFIGGVDTNGIARWDGEQWHPMGSGFGAESFPIVYALTIFDGQLIAGGNFNSSGGTSVRRVARWDGSTWKTVGLGILDGEVRALKEFNGSLIAGGTFTLVSSTPGPVLANRIARFYGTDWMPLQGGVDGNVLALAVYGGDLYVGGQFNNANGSKANRLARWSDLTGQIGWHALTDNTISGHINSLRQIGEMLFIVGSFSVHDTSIVAVATWRTGVPAIIEHPENIHAMAGEDVTFSVTVEADANGPTWFFGWRRNGEWLSFESLEPTFTLHNVTEADIGAYDVVVYNSCGINYSKPAALTVTSVPTCPADLTGNGSVGVPDLLMLLSAWGPCP